MRKRIEEEEEVVEHFKFTIPFTTITLNSIETIGLGIAMLCLVLLLIMLFTNDPQVLPPPLEVYGAYGAQIGGAQMGGAQIGGAQMGGAQMGGPVKYEARPEAYGEVEYQPEAYGEVEYRRHKRRSRRRRAKYPTINLQQGLNDNVVVEIDRK